MFGSPPSPRSTQAFAAFQGGVESQHILSVSPGRAGAAQTLLSRRGLPLPAVLSGTARCTTGTEARRPGGWKGPPSTGWTPPGHGAESQSVSSSLGGIQSQELAALTARLG